jgi:predicted nuclease of predicted toxin-antitoxin system
MKSLVDRCAGRRLADWLRSEGHDVIESHERGPDPGDRTLLEWAAREGRVLVTIDTDFGALVFVEGMPPCGVVWLSDVVAETRSALMRQVLERHDLEVETDAIITVRGGRIRISRPLG